MHADGADELAALDDAGLMVLFARGDGQAARLLTARLLPRALRHAARVLGDAAEAEDVAQEAMMRLWRAALDWRPVRPTRWLLRLVLVGLLVGFSCLTYWPPEWFLFREAGTGITGIPS